MRVDPTAVYQYLRQKGLSDAWARGIMANIEAETDHTWDPTINEYHPTVPGSRGGVGFFQHTGDRRTALESYLQDKGGLSNWQGQIDFSLDVEGYMNRIRSHGDVDANEATRWWLAIFEAPASMKTNPEKTIAARQALLSKFSGIADMTPTVTAAQIDPYADPYDDPFQQFAPTANPYEGMRQIAADGKYYLVGDIGGASIVWSSDSPIPGMDAAQMTGSQFESWKNSGHVHMSYDTLPDFGGLTWQQRKTGLLMDSGYYNTPAMNDLSTMDVFAEALARGMGKDEFRNRIRLTDYSQSLTDQQKLWDDANPTEQAAEIMNAAAQLADSWFTYAGGFLDIQSYDQSGDGNVTPAEIRAANPGLYQQAYSVASGQSSLSTSINQWIKHEAANDPESPWSQRLRDQEAAGKKSGNDAENYGGQIVDSFQKFGVPISYDAATELGKKIVSGDVSMADVMEGMKDQATGLYPNKPRGIDTMSWAAPYLSTYETLMESPNPGLMNNDIQKALSSGMSIGDFRKMIKSNPKWMYTKNAKDEMATQFMSVGRMMGFE